MERHNQSFFGQKTGLILDSAGITDPWLFVRCLKKKESGQWEKPSANEGKKVKLNLLEIIAIVDILKRDGKWGTVHKYQEEQTQIVVENQQGSIKFQIGGYLKQFKFPESTFLLLLLEHILEEKIIHATGGNHGKSDHATDPVKKETIHSASDVIEFVPTAPSGGTEDPIENTEDFENPFDETAPAPAISSENKTGPISSVINPGEWFKNLQVFNEFVLVPGEILATRDKSLNFQVVNGKSIWIPISQTMGNNDAPTLGGLWIRKWLVTKKLLDIFPDPSTPSEAIPMEVVQ